MSDRQILTPRAHPRSELTVASILADAGIPITEVTRIRMRFDIRLIGQDRPEIVMLDVTCPKARSLPKEGSAKG